MKINMPTLKLSGIGLFCALITLVLFATCSKDNSVVGDTNTTPADKLASSSEESSTHNPFNRFVGGSISKELAKRWIENYVKMNGEMYTYRLASSVFEEILKDPSVDGVVLYFAETKEGEKHLLPFGVRGGKRLKAEVVATSDGFVSWEEAMEMISNHRGEIRSHFFGANTFETLINERRVKTVSITVASDERNADRILLTDGDSPGNGLEEGDYDPLDKSWACPYLCDEDEL